MRTSSCILTAILLLVVSANAQVKSEWTFEAKSYPRVQEVDLTPCAADCFARGWVHIGDPDTYIFKLEKGQKLQVEIAWHELPKGTIDPTGRADFSRNGFTITGPDSKVIPNTKNKYLIDPPEAGIYTLVVQPRYNNNKK